MLPPGAANTLPVFHQGLTRLYGGLCLLSLLTLWWAGLQGLEALLGLLKSLVGLPHTTQDGQCISLGQVMAQVKQIRDAQAAQTCVGEFDQCLGPVTHQVQHLGAKRLEPRLGQAVPGVIAAVHAHLFHQQIATGKLHETSIMRCKKVSSTDPMTGRISPWTTPSFSHVAAVSKMIRSRVCMTRRRALGEHPTCHSR